MEIGEFVHKKSPAWMQFEKDLSHISRSSFKKAGKSGIDSLAQRYRRLTSDYAYVQTFFPGTVIESYLNHLVGKAHNAIYRRHETSARDFLTSITSTFPDHFRKNITYFFLAMATFMIATGAGFMASLANKNAAEEYAGPGIMSYLEEGRMWTESILHILPPVISAGIITNNISVTFSAFALGCLAGIGTLYILFMNGLTLGILSSLCFQYGMASEFWSFVLPHGILELSAIFIASQGGLMIGDAIVNPRDYPRGEFIRKRAREAAVLMVGAIPVLILAGLIEGYVSPAEFYPGYFKVGFGMYCGLVLYSYLFLSHGARPGNDPVIPQSTKR